MMDQIKQHTSIRKYKDKPIPQQVMDNIFTAIQMAPSWINGQQYSTTREAAPTTRKRYSYEYIQGNNARAVRSL